ncbi:hypothetical protein Dimus_016361 [Dionaea muscipula]
MMLADELGVGSSDSATSGTKAKEDLVAATHASWRCIPYRYKGSCKNGTEVEVLVISSQKARGKGMMFPKMNRSKKLLIENHLKKLVFLGELGTWSYKSKSHNTIYEGRIFSLLVEEQLDLWSEKNVQQRLWMTVGEAAKEVCGHWWMKEDLDVLIQRLAAPKTHGLWQPERKETQTITNHDQIQSLENKEFQAGKNPQKSGKDRSATHESGKGRSANFPDYVYNIVYLLC